MLGRLKANSIAYFYYSLTFVKYGGEGWIRTIEGLRRQIYSLVHLAALVPHQILRQQNLIPKLLSKFRNLKGTDISGRGIYGKEDFSFGFVVFDCNAAIRASRRG